MVVCSSKAAHYINIFLKNKNTLIIKPFNPNSLIILLLKCNLEVLSTCLKIQILLIDLCWGFFHQEYKKEWPRFHSCPKSVMGI